MEHPVARRLAILAAALCSAAAVLLSQAPAAFVAAFVRTQSQGRVVLGDPAGTLWNGSAEVILAANPDDAGGATPVPTSRTRVPGRLAWQIDAWRLLLGSLSATLRDPAVLDSPLALHADLARNATIDADRLRLPASVLAGLGTPWNTIRPGGEVTLEWETLHLQGDELRGRVQAEWIDASSALSPIVPFGHYRLEADGFFDGAQVRLETLSGPMEMTGNGTIAHGQGLRFRGSAHVQPGTDATVATQLSGLISLLGRRDGDAAILSFGT